MKIVWPTKKILRDGRIDLTKQGIYDQGMMNVLKRARCTVEKPILNVRLVANKSEIMYIFVTISG